MFTLAKPTARASAEPTNPQITVIRDRNVPSPESEYAQEHGLDPAAVQAMPLSDALAKEHPSDAYLVQYAPAMLGERDDGTPFPVRLASGCFEEGIHPRMVVLAGDIDAPKKKRTPEWTAETEAKLEALTGWAWYRTRNGYRILGVLDEPVTLTSLADAEAWKASHAAWRAEIETHYGLVLDPACGDWTRLFRLPNVVRDGAVERSDVRGLVGGKLPVVSLPAAPARPNKPAAVKSPVKPTPAIEFTPGADAIDKAVAIAKQMPESVSGQRGNEALFQCARDVASALLLAVGPDDLADATELALQNHFNPRCIDQQGNPFPWEDSVIRRNAERAAEHAERLRGVRRGLELARAAREAREAATEATTNAEPADGTDDADESANNNASAFPGIEAIDLSEPDAPLRYVVKDLGIGWVGKVCGVLGYAGTGKGPFLNLLALCVASGKPFLGHETKRVPVVLLDAETGKLLPKRLKRMARTLGVDLAALQADGWLTVGGARPGGLVELLPTIEAMIAHVDKGEGVAVMLDSYSSLHGGEKNAAEYADPLWALGHLGESTNAVAIVALHQRKTQRNGEGGGLESIDGHNHIGAALSTVVQLSRPDENDRDRIAISCTRAPEASFKAFEIKWRDTADGGLTATRTVKAAPVNKQVEKQAKAAAERAATDDKNARQIAQVVYEETHNQGVHVNLTTRAVRDLTRLGGALWKRAADRAQAVYGVRAEPIDGNRVYWTCEKPPDTGFIAKLRNGKPRNVDVDDRGRP